MWQADPEKSPKDSARPKGTHWFHGQSADGAECVHEAAAIPWLACRSGFPRVTWDWGAVVAKETRCILWCQTWLAGKSPKNQGFRGKSSNEMVGFPSPLFVHSRLPPPAPPAACLTHNLLTHTTCPHTTYSHTHNLLTHNLSTHNLLTHTQLVLTQLVHTKLVHTQLTLTQLVHTQLVHTQLTLTQLVHTQFTHTRTHNFLTHTTYPHTQLTHTQLVLTQLVHTQLVHTQLTHTQLTHTQLGDMDLHFAWQEWHLWHWAGSGGALGSRGRRCRRGCLRGRRGTWRHRRALGVAGVALGDIQLHFAWQAWHLATSTLTLRGRRGTWRHRPSLCDPRLGLLDENQELEPAFFQPDFSQI